jgi:hypothetical protein
LAHDPTSKHTPQFTRVYTSVSTGIGNMPSSIRIILIQMGISRNTLPQIPLNMTFDFEKEWWFSVENSMIYPSKVFCAHKYTYLEIV